MQPIRIGVSSTLHTLMQRKMTNRSQDDILEAIYSQIRYLQRLRASGASPNVLVLSTYALIDGVIQSIGHSHPVSCKKGCAFCCKMNVDVSPMEVTLIREYTKRHQIPVDLDYLKAQAAIPKEQIVFAPALSACVFLEKDNTCGIYPVRPLACRKYIVTNPPERCNAEAFPDAVLDVLIDMDVEILVSALDSLQLGQVDGLHKVLLQQLSEKP